MHCEQLEFDTVGGRQPLHLHRAAIPARATVLIAPALGIPASYYTRLAQGIASSGLDAARVDQPGVGESPARASRTQDWGYADLIEHYRQGLARLRRDGADSLYLLGHSIGGQAALMLAGDETPGLRGTMIVASGGPWWRAWPGLQGWRNRLSIETMATITRLLGHFPGRQLGFGGREPRQLIAEWAQASRSGRYRHGTFDGDAALRRPGPPVLAICLRGDALAPEAAMRRTLERVDARELSFERWENPPKDGDHNRWPSEPQWVVQRLTRFVGDTVG